MRNLLDSVVDRGAPTHANRLLAFIRRFFNWAVDRDLIEASPATGIKARTVEISRERTLNQEELAAVWNGSGALECPFRQFFRLLILTGQRRNEVAGMQWKEVDLTGRIWTIPGARAKNGKEHIVHLSDAAIAELSSIPRSSQGDLVFTTNGTTSISGFSRAKAALDKESGGRTGVYTPCVEHPQPLQQGIWKLRQWPWTRFSTTALVQ